ncbi:MAG: hypothetical protein VYE68_09325, partial [Acidobacteriota bacterium]|nr:hypothetical protein [Acidobacteriota bacterium]
MRSLEELVLRATALDAAGRGDEAETHWNEIIARAVWMRTYARRALVKSLVARRQPERAGPILDELTTPDANRHLDLILLVADAYTEAGEFHMSTGLYRDVLRRQRHGADSDQARLGLAATLEAQGHIGEALGTLREAQLQHRTGGGYHEAKRAEQRLPQPTRNTPPSFTSGEYRGLVRRLRRTARYADAQALIDEWRAADLDPDHHLDYELIGVLYDARSNEEALARCAQFTERHPHNPNVPDVKLTEFRLSVRMGDTEASRQRGLRLWQGHIPGATGAQRFAAGELLAAYLVAVGDVDGGLELYRGLFRAATDGDSQRRMLWKAGVAAVRDGQHDRALTNLRALNDRGPTGDLAPAGPSWPAVAEPTTGRTDRAGGRFQALVDTPPFGDL